jgi:hypothetical protein
MTLKSRCAFRVFSVLPLRVVKGACAPAWYIPVRDLAQLDADTLIGTGTRRTRLPTSTSWRERQSSCCSRSPVSRATMAAGQDSMFVAPDGLPVYDPRDLLRDKCGSKRYLSIPGSGFSTLTGMERRRAHRFDRFDAPERSSVMRCIMVARDSMRQPTI